MRSMLRVFAVISIVAYPSLAVPAAFDFSFANPVPNASTVGVTHVVAKQSYNLGQLVIEAPWARATPQGAEVGAGYVKITNTGKEADRLTGGSLPVATSVEVHQMTMSDGVMKMRKMDNGIEIKPGQTVELKPGGHHLMLIGLHEGLKQGQTVKGTLQFEKAGSIEVEFHVAPIGAKGAGTSGTMSHMHMQH
jgi:periplasmic copper chaperone A